MREEKNRVRVQTGTNLAIDAGEEEGLALPLAGLTRDLYKLASLHGYGSKDFGVMLDFLRGSSKNRF